MVVGICFWMAGQKVVEGAPAAGSSTSFPVSEAGTEESWFVQCLNVSSFIFFALVCCLMIVIMRALTWGSVVVAHQRLLWSHQPSRLAPSPWINHVRNMCHEQSRAWESHRFLLSLRQVSQSPKSRPSQVRRQVHMLSSRLAPDHCVPPTSSLDVNELNWGERAAITSRLRKDSALLRAAIDDTADEQDTVEGRR